MTELLYRINSEEVILVLKKIGIGALLITLVFFVFRIMFPAAGIDVKTITKPEKAISGDTVNFQVEAVNSRTVASYLTFKTDPGAAIIRFIAKNQATTVDEEWPVLPAEFRSEFGSFRTLKVEPGTTKIIVRIYVETAAKASAPVLKWKDEGPCESWKPGPGPG